jgi:hypothetical protein
MSEDPKDLKPEADEIFPVPETPEELLSQLIDAYPREDFPTLRKVIALGKVKYMDKGLLPGAEMTAAVMNTRPPTLVFGKSFLEKNTKTVEDRVYLLSHELTHLVLDHFAPDIIKKFEEAKPIKVKDEETGEEKDAFEKLTGNAANIILDCQVNATVVNSLSDPAYHEFIKRYYPQDKIPYAFFRPDGKPEEDEFAVKHNLQATLKDLHERLYSESGVTNKELIDTLYPWFEEKQSELSEMVKKLLGNHKDIMSDKGGAGSNSEELSDLADAVAQDLANYIKKSGKDKPEQEGSGKGEGKEGKESDTPGGKSAGKGGGERERLLDSFLKDSDTHKNIKSKLKEKLVVSPVSRIFKAIDFYVPKQSIRSVIPNFHDRRTAVLYSKGKLPVFHRKPHIGSKVIVPCYLDVSGSQDHVLDDTSLAVSRLRQELGNVVYCFSTIIHEARIPTLKERGSIKTTGGTCFNIVAEHILDNGYKCAVILTDGEAYLREDLILKLQQRGVHITVGWTVPHPRKSPLDKVLKKAFYVFDNTRNFDEEF